MKYKNCMVVGKFMPPHKGHEYLIRFAQNYAQNVHVIVDSFDWQTVSPEQRKKWIEEEIPDVIVHALKGHMPQDPADTPDFWPIWKKVILDIVAPDVVIASMDYGWELARVLGADFIPIDIQRESLPISATMIRTDNAKHWDYLMDSAKPYFVKKICLLGPESTGKSVLAKRLADTLETRHVPEYAKAVIERQNGEFFLEQTDDIAFAQISSEKALSKFARQWLICDSCAITTKVFSEWIFGTSTPYVDNLAKTHIYDKYILFYPDNDFTPDIHRRTLAEPEGQRLAMFYRFEEILKSMAVDYRVIEGSYEEKYHKALNFSMES